MLTAKIVDLTDLSTTIATCENTSERGGGPVLNDVGGFTITFQNDDPALASVVTPNSLVTFMDDGVEIFTGIFEARKARIVDPDGPEKQITTWTGRGHVALLDRVLIYPSLQLGAKPIEEDRQCSWEANIYDWVAHGAVAATTVDTLANAQAGSLGGTNWDTDQLDASTEVIGPTGATTASAPVGYWYFNHVVTVPADSDYQIQLTADNAVDAVFDGAHIINAAGDVQAAWAEMSTYNIFLTAGLHTLSGKVYNGGGPTGVAFTIAVVNGDGTLGTVIATSQAAFTVVIDYPAEEPGMTPGEAIELFVDEARNGTVLGALAGTDRAFGDPLAAINLINLTFDAVNDSASQPWTQSVLPATKIGTTLLTFLREMAAAAYIDFSMTPGTLDLNCWIGGTRGSVKAIDFHPRTDPDDETTGNLTEHDETTEA